MRQLSDGQRMIEDQKHEKNSKIDEGNVDEHFAIMEASLIK